VARCWAYETAVLLNREGDTATGGIGNEIPYNDYYEYFAPDYELHLTPEPMENANGKDVLDSVRTELLQQISNLQSAPSVAMQQVPPLFTRAKDSGSNRKDVQDDGDADPDKRQLPYNDQQQPGDSGGGVVRKQHAAEFYDKVD
jgi:histone deacetylase 1/2